MLIVKTKFVIFLPLYCFVFVRFVCAFLWMIVLLNVRVAKVFVSVVEMMVSFQGIEDPLANATALNLKLLVGTSKQSNRMLVSFLLPFVNCLFFCFFVGSCCSSKEKNTCYTTRGLMMLCDDGVDR
jgi:hypothetical protein